MLGLSLVHDQRISVFSEDYVVTVIEYAQNGFNTSKWHTRRFYTSWKSMGNYSTLSYVVYTTGNNKDARPPAIHYRLTNIL